MCDWNLQIKFARCNVGHHFLLVFWVRVSTTCYFAQMGMRRPLIGWKLFKMIFFLNQTLKACVTFTAWRGPFWTWKGWVKVLDVPGFDLLLYNHCLECQVRFWSKWTIFNGSTFELSFKFWKLPFFLRGLPHNCLKSLWKFFNLLPQV